MGWWKIKDIETGMVDFDHKCPTNDQFVNAVPGHEPDEIGDPEDLYNGDGPADLMGPILRKISKQYEDAWAVRLKRMN